LDQKALDWLDRLLARKPAKVVAVALAARMARIVRALIARGGSHQALPGCGKDRRRTRPAAQRWRGAT
jgi:hypothetical protein